MVTFIKLNYNPNLITNLTHREILQWSSLRIWAATKFLSPESILLLLYFIYETRLASKIDGMEENMQE